MLAVLLRNGVDLVDSFSVLCDNPFNEKHEKIDGMSANNCPIRSCDGN